MCGHTAPVVFGQCLDRIGGQNVNGARSPQPPWLCYHAPFQRSPFEMYWFTRPLMTSLLSTALTLCLMPNSGEAQSPPDSSATTEQSCSFGMAKGDPTHQCQVPIPAGCVIAHFPGTKKPWTTVSKAGRTFCTFEEKTTDWKTRITGQCTRCDSNQCTGQFMVRFDCSKP